MTIPMFPETWKRSRRSGACDDLRHHKCKAWNCGCGCHCEHEEADR